MTDRYGSGFSDELHISPKPVIAITGIVALMIACLGDIGPVARDWTAASLCSLLLFGLAAVAWFLDEWHRPSARWFVVAALCAAIRVGHAWLPIPGMLTLMAIPTALAGALISVPASGGVAALATVLMIMPGPIASGDTLLAPLAATWGIFGVIIAIYHPIEQTAQWSWEYFQRAHELLEEARDRKAALEQALQDLAHANLQLTRLNSLAHRGPASGDLVQRQPGLILLQRGAAGQIG